jgi:hypothetical protein
MQKRVDLVELARDRGTMSVRLGGCVRGRPLEGGVVVEDGVVQLAQRRLRFHSQLVTQTDPDGMEHAGSFRLVAAALRRHHQLPGWPLTQRVLGQQRLELRNRLRVAAESKVGLDAILPRGEAEVVQARAFSLCEGLEREVSQGRAAPPPRRSFRVCRERLLTPILPGDLRRRVDRLGAGKLTLAASART